MIRLAFPRELRLLTPSSFRHVFQDPLRVGSPYITILARPNQLIHPRIGFAISKKQIKLASDRNRIKRVTRDYFRCHQHKLPVMDYVILSRHSAPALANAQIRAELEKLWRRLQRHISKSQSHH